MLGKLLKYEWKATAKFFLLLYLAALILTPITRVISHLDLFQHGVLSILSGLFTFTYVILMIALFIATFILIIYRFYKNMVTEEGYLMHTLPVTPAQHILSKLIVAFCWTVISFLVFLASIFFLTVDSELIRQFKELFTELSRALKLFHINETLFFIEFIVLLLIGIIYYILFIYSSIAIGQVISKHKLIGAFAAAIIINIIVQILTAVICIPVFVKEFNDPEASVAYVSNYLLPVYIALNLALSGVYFCITNYVLKRKLNLE